MTIRVLVSILALAALMPACGAGDGEPTPDPEPGTKTAGPASPAASAAQVSPQSTGTNGGRVYCPTCPIQCDPSQGPCNDPNQRQ